MKFPPSPAPKQLRVVILLSLIFCALSCAQQSSAQQASPQTPRPLITQPVDESQLTVLQGNTHPLARPQFDLGTAPATLPMQRMLLVLKRSAEQDSALESLLADQQDKSSPNYHNWLSPEQFGEQFGPTDADIQTITSWLQSHGFQTGTTKGRTILEFSGSASQVQETFHTTIHKYLVNGEQHWANASDPQIPTALTPAVAGVASLNNFPRKAMNILVGKFHRDKATGTLIPAKPEYTFPSGCVENNFEQGFCFYGVGPYDFATIYNVLPLWNSNINGTGQTIAIVGESNINPQDIADFRSLFGLPAQTTANGNSLNIILNGPDPGIVGDESEAIIDVTWSGSVAPNATIDLVVSQSSETTSGVDLSAVYIVENNLAPVMSESYGECELGIGTTGNQFYSTLWQQAAAQGITVFIAAGDNGSAGCDDFGATPPYAAQYGLQVSGYASTPYNVAVGGTDFNDLNNPSTYWNINNNSTTQASALSYIPEMPWNDSCTNPLFGPSLGYSSSAEVNCNNPQLDGANGQVDVIDTVGGSGGASNCTTPSGSSPANCAGGYSKPFWQTGTGVPSDGKRDLPDVSLFASNGFVNSAYIICQSDQTNGGCNLQAEEFLLFGGTSVSTPAFAGIMALVNQQTGSRQGNANYVLYKLAAKESLSSCNATSSPASSCIFNDITMGTNAMPCAAGSPNCTTSSGDEYGILTGYNAGTGYDQATGLGSVNANNLVTQWSSVTFLPSTTTLNSLTPTTITHGQPVNFSVTVKPQSGTGIPTGEISLLGGPSDTNPASAGFNLVNGTASGTTDLLPGGTYSVTAHYPGDGTYGPSSSSPISVTVSKENSQPQVFLVTFDSNGNIVSSDTNTAVYGSPYLLRVNVENSAGAVCTPVSATAPTGCPSGTVTMTDNGTTLDAGTYTLNSYGYFEDLIVQLPGGTDSVKAAYSGDESFNAATGTASISITPAATSISVPSFPFGAFAGQADTISANVTTTSSGVAPTGTVTFYANGSALGGTVSYSPIAGGATSSASLGATLVTNANAFPTAGTYNVTATYSGDGNYATTTSAGNAIKITFAAPNVSLSPFTQTVSYGGTADLTALVDTTNKTTYPTGTVTFLDESTGVTLSGPTACSNTTDSNGNFACQVTGTFTVTSSHAVIANYSGDANYPPSSSNGITVNMPGFTISPQGGVQVTAGQSQNVTLTINSALGFSGTVSGFACSGLPAEATCTFNPTQVTLPANGTATTTITVTTAALGQAVRAAGNRGGAGGAMAPVGVLLGVCLVGAPLWRKRRRVPVALLLMALVAVTPSCGGGGGGTPNPVPSISSLNPTGVAAGSQIQNLYINGSNFLSSSTVTYNGTLHNSSLQSPTQLQIALAPADVANTGQYPVVVTNPSPGGGASNAANFAVESGTPTGVFAVTVTATSPPITATGNLSMTVQ
jgi:Pro-kumamolisin, activation domain/Bacterial Ig-like domain (group 3)